MERGRLYRSRHERIIGGVAGGLADYFEVDVIIVRILWIIAFFMGGGFFAYLIAWLIIPERPVDLDRESGGPDDSENGTEVREDRDYQEEREKRWRLGGMVLILVGIIFLFRALIPWHSFRDLVPIFLIVLGVIILVGGFKRKD